MHPYVHAQKTPERIAYRMADGGETVTYAQLEARSNRVAQLLRARGLKPGDHLALMLENHPRFYEIVWGAQRAGIVYTAMNHRLGADEARYIIADCGAALVVSSRSLAQTAAAIRRDAPGVAHWLMIDGTAEGWESYEDAVAAQPATRIADETAANDMLYSSGTTGRPKGVHVPPEDPAIDAPTVLVTLAQKRWGVGPDTVYLSPAPLYHAAPLRFNMTVMRLGGTCVIMEHFDPIRYLALVAAHRVTHSQLVPTMFVRMLKLEAGERTRHDLSSLRCAIHAAAPCPVAVKQQMIDWWGPVLHEYYAGTEGNGLTLVDSHDWLRRPGTVGKAVVGVLKICDDAGDELPVGREGTVYFADGKPFAYHNDPQKTAGARNRHGWTTLGDIGRLDEDGYLYLTDRKAFMIISGGVNIYPQEAENLLVTHPAVVDAAVFGVPDAEMGEQVKAVVQPRDPRDAGPALERELIEWLRGRLAHYKCPRSIDFSAQLPREPNGKLYKRALRDPYWAGHRSRIA